jgi:hypothetical protein
MVGGAVTSKRIVGSGFRRISVSMAAALTLFGCAADMVVIPVAPAAPPSGVSPLEGRIVYDGNRDYLPRMLADGTDGARLVFRYGYAVQYGSERTHIAGAMFIPMPILAVPGVMGQNALRVAGHLEVLDGEEVIRVYSASAELKAKASLFYEGETFTDMRRRGLLAVRDSIDAQLVQDRETLIRASKQR